MMLAELGGKVSTAVRQSEDILTSYAFGVIEVLDPAVLLLPWLHRARRLDGSALDLVSAVSAAQICWPTLELGGAGVEPDVLLTLTGSDGATTVVLVEAKFRSGPSGWPTGPDIEEVTGQLGRQWLALSALAPHLAPGGPPAIHRRIMVYLTADLRRPVDVLASMVDEVRKAGNDPEEFRRSLYWLSWRDLALVIGDSPARGVLVGRLKALLAGRSLSVFAGCRAPVCLAPHWTYARPRYALGPPSAVNIAWQYGAS